MGQQFAQRTCELVLCAYIVRVIETTVFTLRVYTREGRARSYLYLFVFGSTPHVLQMRIRVADSITAHATQQPSALAAMMDDHTPHVCR